jgi:hypothetical protein
MLAAKLNNAGGIKMADTLLQPNNSNISGATLLHRPLQALASSTPTLALHGSNSPVKTNS